MTQPRIASSDVEGTLNAKAVDKVTDEDLVRAARVGHAIVSKVDTSDYDSEVIELAEAEAAAHWIMTRKVRQAKQESVGNAQKSYSGTFGDGLESTTHGQMLLDLVPEVEETTKITASIDVPSVR